MLELQTDLIGREIKGDFNGNIKYKIVEEWRCTKLNVSVSNQTEDIVCRYWAAVDCIKGRMQEAESRRHSTQQHYFDGGVPEKLSASHLQQIAPKTDEDVFNALTKRGITTTSEFENLEDNPMGDDPVGCTRHKLDEYRFLANHEIPTDLELHGPGYCHLNLCEHYDLLGEPDSIYLPGRQLYVDEYGQNSTLKKDKELIEYHHAVMIIGYGRCQGVDTSEIEEYAVVQNTWGATREAIGRVSLKNVCYIISPTIIDYR